MVAKLPNPNLSNPAWSARWTGHAAGALPVPGVPGGWRDDFSMDAEVDAEIAAMHRAQARIAAEIALLREELAGSARRNRTDGPRNAGAA